MSPKLELAFTPVFGPGRAKELSVDAEAGQ
jgi:hypothetical protein